MNWRKRSVGLNSIESNNLDEMILTQSNCKSCLDFIDKSMSFVNLFVTIKSKQQHQSIQCYLDSHSKIHILIRKLKIAAIFTTLQLDQIKSNIYNLCILYTDKNTFILGPHKKEPLIPSLILRHMNGPDSQKNNFTFSCVCLNSQTVSQFTKLTILTQNLFSSCL